MQGKKFTCAKAHDFPLDKFGNNIVQLLQLKKWNVPTIGITFQDYGRENFFRVKIVEGNTLHGPFRLVYDRVQGVTLGGWQDRGGLTRIIFCNEELYLMKDEYGKEIAFYKYTGENWKQDNFMIQERHHEHVRKKHAYKNTLLYIGSDSPRNMLGYDNIPAFCTLFGNGKLTSYHPTSFRTEDLMIQYSQRLYEIFDFIRSH